MQSCIDGYLILARNLGGHELSVKDTGVDAENVCSPPLLALFGQKPKNE